MACESHYPGVNAHIMQAVLACAAFSLLSSSDVSICHGEASQNIMEAHEPMLTSHCEEQNGLVCEKRSYQKETMQTTLLTSKMTPSGSHSMPAFFNQPGGMENVLSRHLLFLNQYFIILLPQFSTICIYVGKRSSLGSPASLWTYHTEFITLCELTFLLKYNYLKPTVQSF